MDIKHSFELDGCILNVSEDNNRIYYEYGTEDYQFSFSLFCEIGRPYQPTFQEIIDSHNLKIVLFDQGREYYERLDSIGE